MYIHSSMTICLINLLQHEFTQNMLKHSAKSNRGGEDEEYVNLLTDFSLYACQYILVCSNDMLMLYSTATSSIPMAFTLCAVLGLHTNTHTKACTSSILSVEIESNKKQTIKTMRQAVSPSVLYR